MQIISFGCSFIYGSDLADTKNETIARSASKRSWPALVAEHLGYGYFCQAHGGSGNLCILDRLLNAIQKNNQPSFYIIGWTYIDRFDYRDKDGGITGLNDWASVRPDSREKSAKYYYQDLHSEYADKLNSLLAIKTAIDVLESKNLPFLMTYMDDLIFDNQYNTSPGMRYLQEFVAPHLHSFEGKNFLQWSNEHGYPISINNHPLEEAHRAAACYMIPIIDAILHRA